MPTLDPLEQQMEVAFGVLRQLAMILRDKGYKE